jgi:putative transposase
MSFYRRRLPHWQPEETPIFLTWRLFGSMPKQRQTETKSDLTEGQRFLAMDRQMDAAISGPAWLKHPAIAALVADTLLVAGSQWGLYKLFAWVVMSNHVHVLLKPYKKLADVTRAIKKTSATKANLILARSGQPFWQEESYDHWVRDAREFDRILRYIEWNPVRAGLVERPEDWPWSSASESWRQVGNLPHDASLVSR